MREVQNDWYHTNVSFSLSLSLSLGLSHRTAGTLRCLIWTVAPRSQTGIVTVHAAVRLMYLTYHNTLFITVLFFCSTCNSLSKFCPKLKHLDLASCTSITNLSLKALRYGQLLFWYAVFPLILKHIYQSEPVMSVLFLSLSNIMLEWWIPSIKHDHLAEFQNKYMKPEISLISPLQSYVLLVGCDSFFLFKPTQVTEEIRIMWEDFNFVMHLTFPLTVIAPFILCKFPLLTLFFVLFSVRVVLCWSSWTFPGVIKSRRMASRPWCAPALVSNVFSSRAAPRYTRDYVIISCWQFHSV